MPGPSWRDWWKNGFPGFLSIAKSSCSGSGGSSGEVDGGGGGVCVAASRVGVLDVVVGVLDRTHGSTDRRLDFHRLFVAHELCVGVLGVAGILVQPILMTWWSSMLRISLCVRKLFF